jgi:Lrp/AsnC family transcriptional regulator, leucine-responsive regulatory protein
LNNYVGILTQLFRNIFANFPVYALMLHCYPNNFYIMRIIMHVDPIDHKILSILSKDSALTSEALGEQVGLSPSATHRRVKAMEDAGIIKGYRAVMSRAARGNPATVYISVTLVDQRKETMETFEAALSQAPIVTEAHLMSGEYDYLLKAEIPESDSFERVHREVFAALPGVHRLVTHFSIRGVLVA